MGVTRLALRFALSTTFTLGCGKHCWCAGGLSIGSDGVRLLVVSLVMCFCKPYHDISIGRCVVAGYNVHDDVGIGLDLWQRSKSLLG